MLFLYNPCMLCQITASISIKQKPQSTHPVPGTRAGSRMWENSRLKATQSQEREKARKHGGESVGGVPRGEAVEWDGYYKMGNRQTYQGHDPKDVNLSELRWDDRGPWSLVSHRPSGHKELDLTQQVGNNRQGPLEEPMQNLCQRRLHSGQSPRISLPLPHSDSALQGPLFYLLSVSPSLLLTTHFFVSIQSTDDHLWQ